MTTAAAKGDPRMSQTDIVVDRIRRMIIDGDLAPGARLPVEGELSELFGVSRGSLREGVRALAMMGVLQVRQGAGTFVTSLDSSVLLAPMEFVVALHSSDAQADIHAVRRVLEVEACGLAATRIDDAGLDRAESVLAEVDLLLASGTFDHARALQADAEFHEVIADYCGNPVLRALADALSSQTLRARMWRALAADGVSHSTHREHRAILAALRDHDVERARLRMNIHLLEVQEFIGRSTPE